MKIFHSEIIKKNLINLSLSKYIALFVLITTQVGCTTPHNKTLGAKSFLEGTWQSNKKLTISNFTENQELTEKKKNYLVKNLGELTLVFQSNKIAVYFEEPEKLEKIDWGLFKVISQNKKEFTLSVTNQQITNKHFTYFWEKKCFYLKQPKFGYNEYFCKIR